MSSPFARLLVVALVPIMSGLCPAAPPTSAPAAASRSVDECIATVCVQDRPITAADIEAIQTLADAFPLSNQRLAHLLDLASAKCIRWEVLNRLTEAVRTHDRAGLAQDQLTFLRVVANGTSLRVVANGTSSPLAHERIVDHELRASAILGASPVNAPSPSPVSQAQQAAVLVAFLDECQATGVQQVWAAAELYPARNWRRQPVFDAVRARFSYGLPSAAPTLLLRALVFDAEGERARATVLLARVLEGDPFGEPRFDNAYCEFAASLYETWNKTSPSFRFLCWLARHLPGSGRPRLYLGMAVVALGFHLLQLPILLKTRRSLKEKAPRALWLTGALTFTQLLPVIWAIAIGPAWVFAFDGGQPWLGQGIIRFVAGLGGLLLLTVLAGRRSIRRTDVVGILGGLVLGAIAGALLIIEYNDLLSGVGLDVAAFMMITGPVPLAIYVGVLLWRRRRLETA